MTPFCFNLLTRSVAVTGSVVVSSKKKKLNYNYKSTGYILECHSHNADRWNKE